MGTTAKPSIVTGKENGEELKINTVKRTGQQNCLRSKRYSNDKVCHCVKFASDVPDCVSLGFAVTRQTLA